MSVGKVYLVGAGPGDPGLLTVKGRECLEKADVVVYDRLANFRLLRFAPPHAELIYAGKSPGGHTLSQKAINELLVRKAEEGRVVVRLKGGDPFVFGRGGEEAEALAAHGIPFEVVPGVTAAVAVPAYAGIPVTHRRYNSSFAVIAGNEETGKEKDPLAWEKLAGSFGTLIFLMGRQNLPSICARLIMGGRDPATPAAVIERGTAPEQRTVVGTLENIAGLAEEASIANPAVIVVGEVVALREKLLWREKEPLFGRRIVITRALPQAGTLAAALEAKGGEVWEFPTIEIAPPIDPAPLEKAAREAGSYDWLIFTSVNGVMAFFKRLMSQGGDSRLLAGVKIAVIGEATGRALGQWGLKADVLPKDYRAEGLLDALEGEEIAGKKVLLPRAEVVRPILAQRLRERGALVEEVVAYRTITPQAESAALRSFFEAGKVDAITFTSSSTVRNFCAIFGEETPRLLRGVAVASIGPVTSETARELGLKVDIEASTSTVLGLVEALVKYFQEGNASR